MLHEHGNTPTMYIPSMNVFHLLPSRKLRTTHHRLVGAVSASEGGRLNPARGPASPDPPRTDRRAKTFNGGGAPPAALNRIGSRSRNLGSPARSMATFVFRGTTSSGAPDWTQRS